MLAFSSINRNTKGIAQRTWAEGSKDICLIHGFLANSYWWSWMMQDFLFKERVFAPDLSGMGQSDWLSQYSLLTHIEEISKQLSQPSWLIGHSYGGWICYALASKYPDKVKGVILIDSPLHGWDNIYVKHRGSRVCSYTDLSLMKKSFALFPKQPWCSTEIKEELFKHSIKYENDTYHWIFDPELLNSVPLFGMIEIQTQIRQRLYYISGGNSQLSNEQDYHLLKQWSPHTIFHVIENAYHAVLLDEPKLLSLYIEQCVKEHE